MPEATAPEVTHDTWLGGSLSLCQPARGHRVGTDAVLLAAAAPRGFVGRVYDVGAGVGAVGLAVALASPQASVALIERDPVCAALADANIAANGLASRVSAVRYDLLAKEPLRTLVPDQAELVVTNPPFYQADRVRLSPEARRRDAHALAPGDLEAWLRACLSLLSAKGTLILIHRAEALPDLLRLLDGRLGALAVMTVHARAGQPATRVLVRGIKGSRAPLEIAAPLVLHDGNGFTEAAEKLHAGTSSLAW